MYRYNIPKEISSETKIFSFLFLKDLILLLVAYIIISHYSSYVIPKLQIPYYIVNVSFALFLVLRNKHNPGKRNLFSIIYFIKRDRKCYNAIEIPK